MIALFQALGALRNTLSRLGKMNSWLTRISERRGVQLTLYLCPTAEYLLAMPPNQTSLGSRMGKEREEGFDKGLHPKQTPEIGAKVQRGAKERHFYPLHGLASFSQCRTIIPPPLWLRHELEFKIRNFDPEANTP
jgi:hypothetical protein